MAQANEESEEEEGEESKESMLTRHRREIAFERRAVKQLKKKEANERLQAVAQRHADELMSAGFAIPDDHPSAAAAWHSETNATDGSSFAASSPYSNGATKRLTKAQRRRSKKQQEEAERERRIAEEKACQGPNDAEIEDARLHAKLEELSLQVHPIKPDGHCMYRAVAHSAGVDDSDEGVFALRRQVAGFLRKHADEYAPFFDEDSGGLEGWCRHLETTGAWGGFLELRVLSKVLKHPVIVHSAALDDMSIATDEFSHKPPVRVSYHKHAYGLGEHYNSLVPK